MPIISYMGEDFDSPNIQVQDNGSATDLDDTKVPTGRTVESYANSKIQNDGSATDLDNTKVPTGQTIESFVNKKFAKYYGNTSTNIPINSWTSGASITVQEAGVYAVFGACFFTSENGNQGINLIIGSSSYSQSFLTYSYGQPNTQVTMWIGSISANTVCSVGMWSGVARTCPNYIAAIKMN